MILRLFDCVNSYQEYLKSVGWKLTKYLRKANTCEICGTSRRPLDLHHWSYDWHNAYTFLRFVIPNMTDEMSTLCRKCHKKTHRKEV